MSSHDESSIQPVRHPEFSTTPPRLDASEYSLRVDELEVHGVTAEFALSDVQAVKALAEQLDVLMYSFSSNCPDLGFVLECLEPLADPGLDEVNVNAATVVIASTEEGRPVFVPRSDEPGVEVIASGSSTWLPGGPCVMAQYEELLRFGNLYWAEATGDSDQQSTVAGRFDDPTDGLAAAVEVSLFFRFGPDGEIICELDSWPQDE